MKIGFSADAMRICLGNIAIKLDADMSSREEMIPFSPVKGKPLTQPTFAECDSAKLVGKMYYELHPQLWGQGIVSEAFAEVLRFGFEELGCTSISVSRESSLSWTRSFLVTF